MKKLVLLFATAVLALTSCTNNKTNSTSTIISGLIKTATDGTNVTTYIYNSSKIVKEVGANYTHTYTYTGDLITGMMRVQENYVSSIEYTYDKGKLISELIKSNGGIGTTFYNISGGDYTYNADGTVTARYYYYSNGSAMLYESEKLGNLVKVESFNAQEVIDHVTTYEYDTKNNPFKGILGYDKLIVYELISASNIIKSTETNSSGSDSSTTITTNAYTYNIDGYPLTQTTTTVSTQGTNVSQTTTSNKQYGY